MSDLFLLVCDLFFQLYFLSWCYLLIFHVTATTTTIHATISHSVFAFCFRFCFFSFFLILCCHSFCCVVFMMSNSVSFSLTLLTYWSFIQFIYIYLYVFGSLKCKGCTVCTDIKYLIPLYRIFDIVMVDSSCCWLSITQWNPIDLGNHIWNIC